MALESLYMKTTKAHFIQMSTILSQNDMYINTAQPYDGLHLKFLNFEALSTIF